MRQPEIIKMLPTTAARYTNIRDSLKLLEPIGTILKLDRIPIVVAQVRGLEARYGWEVAIYNDTTDDKVMYVQHVSNKPITTQTPILTTPTTQTQPNHTEKEAPKEQPAKKR